MHFTHRISLLAVFLLSLASMPVGAQSLTVTEDQIGNFIRTHEQLMDVGPDFARRCHGGEMSPGREGWEDFLKILKDNGFRGQEPFDMTAGVVEAAFANESLQQTEKELTGENQATMDQIQEGMKDPTLGTDSIEALQGLKNTLDSEYEKARQEVASATFETKDLLEPRSREIIERNREELAKIVKFRSGE